MIDQLELGPVVGSTGGGVEIITEEVDINNETRTWELPDEWESGLIAAEGTLSKPGYSSSDADLFGMNLNSKRGSSHASAFQSLDDPAEINMDGSSRFQGTITLIRAA